MNAASEVHGLVVAKAPVPGLAKTRLGRTVGMQAAAELAAAALLDTIEVFSQVFPGRCHVALSGDLGEAIRSDDLTHALLGWSLHPQRGDTLGERLAHAHADVAAGPVVQVGMDTPQVNPALLGSAVAALTAGAAAAVGPAEDGGWWLLALADPGHAQALVNVAMSQPDTGAATVAALRPAVGEPVTLPQVRDVDTAEDAAHVAALIPDSHFGRAWALTAGATA